MVHHRGRCLGPGPAQVAKGGQAALDSTFGRSSRRTNSLSPIGCLCERVQDLEGRPHAAHKHTRIGIRINRSILQTSWDLAGRDVKASRRVPMDRQEPTDWHEMPG
jgi:hypothetical protein